MEFFIDIFVFSVNIENIGTIMLLNVSISFTNSKNSFRSNFVNTFYWKGQEKILCTYALLYTVKDYRKRIKNEGNNFFDLAVGFSCVGN